jgi:hypothetical protein
MFCPRHLEGCNRGSRIPDDLLTMLSNPYLKGRILLTFLTVQRSRQQHLRPRRLQPRLESRLRRKRPRRAKTPLNLQRRTPAHRRRRHHARKPRPARPRPCLRSSRRIPRPAQRRAHPPPRRTISCHARRTRAEKEAQRDRRLHRA